MFDIAFISYNEKEADVNWKKLKDKFPYAKRTHGVKGIHQAHIQAAKTACTEMFFIVDADAHVVEDFDFSYIPLVKDRDAVHVWRSKNPINDLVYGYGGVKLFPRKATINVDVTKSDMTTSISNKFIPMPTISNITAFNTNPFSTWRSAFRECAKLASKTIDRQNTEETNERLKTWTTYAKGNYSGDALRGARDGMRFGLSSSSNINLINDYGWLKEQFDANT